MMTGLIEPHHVDLSLGEKLRRIPHLGGLPLGVHRYAPLRERSERAGAHADRQDAVDPQRQHVLDDASAPVLVVVDILHRLGVDDVHVLVVAYDGKVGRVTEVPAADAVELSVGFAGDGKLHYLYLFRMVSRLKRTCTPKGACPL